MPLHNAKERFEEKWMPVPESGCWLWLAAESSGGYGAFALDGLHSGPAHRASWEIHKGPIPEGEWVLHKCDVRCCVNPEHLFLGDNQANVTDMHSKGRGPVGDKHGRSKLTKTQVDEIRMAHGLASDIAAVYGVNKATVYRIKNGRNWKSGERAVVRLSAHRKVTDQDVQAIRLDGRPHKEIAEQYGIARCTVSLIKSGKRR